MCGIAGFTHSGRQPSDPDLIRRTVDTLRHRGPNQQGVFQSRDVSIGATRLKIIDLAAGDQPIVSVDRSTAIAFNGEIYNHRELRAELEALGHKFQSQADTETVLEAFREWDTDCFRKLRGMFGIALWNERDGRLVLARDRMGIKPLYVIERGGELYFGSELKAILIHPEIERRLCLDGLDCYLSMNYVPAPWTLVEGIRKLPQGHWMEWRAGRTRTEPYWTPPPFAEKNWTDADGQAELDRLLRQSVKEHLASDVTLGVWLSGGVDSSTIVHYAAEACGKRLKTFSISFRGQSFDESDAIARIASHYGTDHQQFDVSAGLDLPCTIEEFAHFSDEPSADAGALPVWFLSKLTKETATVALSGEGADELFGGYLTHRASIYANRARAIPAPLLKLARKAANLLPVSNEKIGFEYKVKRFLDGCLMSPGRAHVYWNGTFSDHERRALVAVDLPRALDSITNGVGTRLADFLAFDQKYYLADDILTKADRISMAHAIEVRPPFLDHRIVEFAATLPDRFKIQGSRQKVILRDLMSGKLPSSTLKRPKIGFDIPAHEWFRGPLRPLLADAVDFASKNHGDFFRMEPIRACVRAHMDKQANLGYHLWGLTTLFLWMRKWNIQTNLAEPSKAARDHAFTSI